MKDKANPLDIDIFNLHEEARKQSRFYKKWSDRHAGAVKRANEDKSAFERVKADLWLKISKRPDKYGLEKTTEKMLEAAVVTQPAYQEAAQLMHDSKHEADTLKGMVEACDSKKRMIELEVQLHFGNYFSEPRVKGEQLAK